MASCRMASISRFISSVLLLLLLLLGDDGGSRKTACNERILLLLLLRRVVKYVGEKAKPVVGSDDSSSISHAARMDLITPMALVLMVARSRLNTGCCLYSKIDDR